MTPTRRTLLGAAGATALSRILLPWRPRPSDLLLADETPAESGHPVLRIERFPASSDPLPNFTVYDGMTVTLDKGDWGTITVRGGILRIGNVGIIETLNVYRGGTVIGLRHARPTFCGTVNCSEGAMVRGD